MSWYTDWFLADEADAEALASLAADETHSFDDWPHLPMRGVGQMELMRLAAILRGSPDDLAGIDQALVVVDPEQGPVVSRVEGEFVAALAALDKQRADRAAADWHGCEEMASWEPDAVAARLLEMAAFARSALREGKPILQLNVW
jgi:hypothetical protein